MDRGYFALQISSLHMHVLPGLQLWFLCLFIIIHTHYSTGLILFRRECDLVHGVGSPGPLNAWEVIVAASSTPFPPSLID